MSDAIFHHRSIRKYKTGAVPEKIMTRILEAGIRASTTGNMQLYSIIVSSDKKIKQELAPCHFNQPMVTQAPHLLTFCADFNRFNLWCELRGAQPGYDNFLSFVTASIDALLVAQNVCIEAEEQGLGICYLGTTTYMAEKIIEVLDLPKGVVPITTITLGYPDESPGLTDRLPLEAVVHKEKYMDYSSDQIEKLYAEKESLEIYRNIVKENNTANLAQVFTDIRYTKKDNISFSKALLKVLEKQGFMNQNS